VACPAGSSNGKGWGNLDYDINIMLNEKAFDASGQALHGHLPVLMASWATCSA